MMEKLYACIGSGNCFKPWLLMNQLEIKFEIELIDVLQGEQKKPAYLDINPVGVVPFLRTSDGAEIGESNAMIWYLAEGTQLMPQTAVERAEALQWLFFEQAKLEVFISPARFFTTIVPDQKEAHADEITVWQHKAKQGLLHLEEHLLTRRFILKSGYSIADIAVFGYVHVSEEAGISMRDYPSIARWMADVSNTDRFNPLSQLGLPVKDAA